ncbi:hypothetical protein [Sphingomonas sp.]|jgi:hypothetical protein|uniref:hypothetical protein n=1 Tax=Sphingomonas sp. TaxID=28214 RepID=UPI002D80AFF4|nr:hypothetical protein [Sphingomonas sp.]HEU0044789.1 hypothetical protein [Sphingomonas sp.]
MGIVDRINDAVLRRIRPARVGDDAAELAGVVEHIEELVATRQEQLVGDTMALIASLDDGRVLRTDEESPGWTDLLAALDRSGRTSLTSTQWQLRLVGADAPSTLTLIPEPPSRTDH